MKQSGIINKMRNIVVISLFVVLLVSNASATDSSKTNCDCSQTFGVHLKIFLDDDNITYSEGKELLYDSIFYSSKVNADPPADKNVEYECEAHGSVAVIPVEYTANARNTAYSIIVMDKAWGRYSTMLATPSGLAPSEIGRDIVANVLIVNIPYYSIEVIDLAKDALDDTLYLPKGSSLGLATMKSDDGRPGTFYNSDKKTIITDTGVIVAPMTIYVEWEKTEEERAEEAAAAEKKQAEEKTAALEKLEEEKAAAEKSKKIFDAFTDIDDHWARGAIEFVVTKGLFYGTSETTFGPSTQMRNGMLMTVLYRNSGSPSVPGSSDTPYYATPMKWGESFITSYGNNMVDPDADGTREQLITMLYSYAIFTGVDVSRTSDLSIFADSDEVSIYARNAMGWAVSEGIIEGKPGNIIDPSSPVTRAQVAVILQRYINLVEVITGVSE